MITKRLRPPRPLTSYIDSGDRFIWGGIHFINICGQESVLHLFAPFLKARRMEVLNVCVMTRIPLKNVVWKEGKNYVAWNINTSVSSFGATRKEALQSLQEALELHLEDVPLSKVQRVERPVLESLSFHHA